jgi:hypothetical protein
LEGTSAGERLDAETKYWTAWSEVEQKRIDEQASTLATLEEERSNPAKQSADLDHRIEDLKTLIAVRTVDMRQNKDRLEAFRFDMTAYYAKSRDEAEEICNTYQPAPRRP